MEIALVIFLFLLENSLAAHCQKVLEYHDNYGYGFDITCENLSNDNDKLLTNILVSNDIVLNISNSNLTKVRADLFNNVPNIRYLSVVNSTFSFDPNEEVFTNLKDLEHLSVTNTEFNKLNQHVFGGLDNLKELILRNCSLKIIANGTFSRLKKLETLKLTDNNFRSLFDIPFCEFASLKYVDLDHNEIQQIENNFLACFENEEESAFLVNGRKQEVSHNSNVYRQSESNLDIVELNLSYNEIRSVGSFDWAPTLKYLDLSNNRFRTITNNEFDVLSDLEKLDLESNLLEGMDKNVFTKLENLQFLNLRNNSLSKIPLLNLSNLEEVDVSRNRLTSSCLTEFTSLSNLRKLFLDDNEIDSLPADIFKNLSSLTVLDISNNKLVWSNESFAGLSSVEQLSISNNNLQVIPPMIFNSMPSLQFLDISSNNLGPTLDYRIFLDLENLKVLNISNNVLENLKYDLLKPFRNLQVLNISKNRLKNFEINLVSLLPSLRVISLESNLFSCSVLSTMITFFKSKDISYTIHENFEDRQNVEGIYCEETSTKEKGVSVFAAVGVIFLVVLSTALFLFMFYKCCLYAKRRRYTREGLELL